MGATIIPEGSDLPLTLALEDGATGKFPQVTLFSPIGTILSTHDLPHVGLGVYTAAGVVMPAQDFVTALYIIYDDAGHTVESATYLRSSETFVQAAYVKADTPIDGPIDLQTALARVNSMASGRVVQTLGNRYTYRNATNTADLFTNEDNTTERTPA